VNNQIPFCVALPCPKRLQASQLRRAHGPPHVQYSTGQDRTGQYKPLPVDLRPATAVGSPQTIALPHQFISPMPCAWSRTAAVPCVQLCPNHVEIVKVAVSRFRRSVLRSERCRKRLRSSMRNSLWSKRRTGSQTASSTSGHSAITTRHQQSLEWLSTRASFRPCRV
jgi:hypothetical protein